MNKHQRDEGQNNRTLYEREYHLQGLASFFTLRGVEVTNKLILKKLYQ